MRSISARSSLFPTNHIACLLVSCRHCCKGRDEAATRRRLNARYSNQHIVAPLSFARRCALRGVSDMSGVPWWDACKGSMRSDASRHDDTFTQAEVSVDANKRARKAVLRARSLRHQAHAGFFPVRPGRCSTCSSGWTG
ncbi:hypothetical protein PCAR4_210179 [Paraburkholderia caribensis]|nr:hypothetical protein PCAR4_210179 [Paraburkholderia caribensis]